MSWQVGSQSVESLGSQRSQVATHFFVRFSAWESGRSFVREFMLLISRLWYVAVCTLQNCNNIDVFYKTLPITYDATSLVGRCVLGSVTISGATALVNYMSRFGGIACPTVLTISSSSSSSPHHLLSSRLYPHHLHQSQQLGRTVQSHKTLIDANQLIVARNSANFGSELPPVCLQISIDRCYSC